MSTQTFDSASVPVGIVANEAAAAQPDFKMKDVITLTARLSQVLAEEVDKLDAHKVHEIESLQREKLFLVSALEAKRKQLDKAPQLMETIPSQDQEDMKEVMEVFNEILAENHRKLMLAREVNHTILRAVTDVVKQKAKGNVYNMKGNTGIAYDALSVTLNKMI